MAEEVKESKLVAAGDEVKVQPAQKSKGGLFKLILILAIIGLIVYLIMNPDIIRNFVDKFLDKLTS